VAYFFMPAAIMAASDWYQRPAPMINRSLYEHVSSDQYPTQYLRTRLRHQLLAAKQQYGSNGNGNGNGNGNTISLSPTRNLHAYWSGTDRPRATFIAAMVTLSAMSP